MTSRSVATILFSLALGPTWLGCGTEPESLVVIDASSDSSSNLPGVDAAHHSNDAGSDGSKDGSVQDSEPVVDGSKTDGSNADGSREDGATEASQPDAAFACPDPQLGNAPLIPISIEDGGLPTPQGGSVIPGDYVLTRRRHYNLQGETVPRASMRRAVLKVEANLLSHREDPAISLQSVTVSYTISGTTLRIALVCKREEDGSAGYPDPDGGAQVSEVPFSADATTISFVTHTIRGFDLSADGGPGQPNEAVEYATFTRR